LLNK
jgi:hypothetical protein